MTQNSTTNHSKVAYSHLGDQGEMWFAASLPRGWVWQPPRRDFGKDGLIVIRDETDLHNLEFSVQIKTSEKPRVRNGSVLLSGVTRSSVRYWFASPLPTLVVAVDISNSRAWYAWHLNLFNSPNEVFGTKARTVTLHIPEENLLNTAGWESIRIQLRQHFRSLQRALTNEAITSHVIGAIYSISRITGNLIRLGRTAPPEPPFTQNEGMALLLEQIELRDLMDTVRAVLSRLTPDSEAHKQIAFWLESFEATASEGHTTINELPPHGKDIPSDFEIGFAPKRLSEVRPQLILSAIDLVRLLTPQGQVQS